ncbi:hypothetical protein GCM10022222_44460 [Amycolatopsis ultiminotia]|uniref:RNA polymerase sigma-70 region 2 domain-containing protein n=1 Tax=Amycolatopsis ultiminotia TaxID=543629 RepID=A0ABP6WTY0_9PSEU
MSHEDEVRRVSAQVVRVVAADPGLRGDAEDACQSAWLDLLARPTALHDRDRLGAWLTTVARRHAIRAVRRRVRRREPEPPVDSPEAAFLAGERATALWQAVAQFPPRQRRLMTLIAHHPELSHEQMAVELGISCRSVSTLRRRCLDVLRRRLESQGFGYP